MLTETLFKKKKRIFSGIPRRDLLIPTFFFFLLCSTEFKMFLVRLRDGFCLHTPGYGLKNDTRRV